MNREILRRYEWVEKTLEDHKRKAEANGPRWSRKKCEEYRIYLLITATEIPKEMKWLLKYSRELIVGGVDA